MRSRKFAARNNNNEIVKRKICDCRNIFQTKKIKRKIEEIVSVYVCWSRIQNEKNGWARNEKLNIFNEAESILFPKQPISFCDNTIQFSQLRARDRKSFYFFFILFRIFFTPFFLLRINSLNSHRRDFLSVRKTKIYEIKTSKMKKLLWLKL